VRRFVLWLLVSPFALLLAPELAWAQSLPLVTTKAAGGSTVYAVPVETVLALTALSFFACRVNSVNEFYSHLDCIFIIASGAGTNDHAAQYCVDWTVFLFDTLHHEPRV